MKRILWASIIASCLISAPAFAKPHNNSHRRPSQRLAEGENCKDNTKATPTPTCTESTHFDDDDGEDSCPYDPNKTDPGVCGCGYPDTDTDNDGTPDCLDYCPDDPNKVLVGKCGCGVSDDTPNCEEPCDVDDDCETPTPTCTPTQTPTCTPTETPTTTPTETPTCTPTETPTETPTPEPSCKFYKGTVAHEGKWRGGAYSGYSYTLRDTVKQDEGTEGLSCLNDTIDRILARCEGSCRKNSWIANYCDDCVAKGVTYLFKLGEKDRCAHWEMMHNLQRVYDNGWVCTSGTFYFDSSCNVVSNEDYSNLCGNVDVRFTLTCPVSLLWEHDYNVNTNQTLVDFKLDPTNTNAWTVWKASDKAPLLVYDPEHTGVVSDASQLFGNWTFGGKRSAALASDVSNVNAGKWENGYEALASLDADGNGKIENAELNDLALWFDANQNGVSEAGEVKAISETGVTALFYKGYQKDALSKDLRLEIGYERNVDGHIVQGSSVDWYAETAESKMDLANFYGFLRDGLEAENAPALASNVANKFGGVWKWYLSDEALAEEVNDGIFILTEQDGAIKGFNFAERRIIESPNNQMNSIGAYNKIEGTHTVKEGKDVFTFSSSQNNMTLQNEAVLLDNGLELNGTTTVTVANGAQVLKYNWKAYKEN